jgi:uncharacterized protein YcbK (DUF882 family)
MTTGVSLLGMFAPATGARDAKATEDNVLASFAGMLAGVNQANANLLAPPSKAEVATNGDELENPEDKTGTADSKTTDDGANGSSASTTNSVTASASTLPTGVNTSVAALNPALQEKLSRVISRMREETGHDVQVTETYRSQGRQNALYAQGRQTAGPVVTWTQNSKHTLGRAVDVTLDGGRAGADAYTLLQRIANEEGLRTLGARDPGHLELPSNSAADATMLPEQAANASSSGQVSTARLAQIANVATVEQVTTVSAGVSREAKLSPTTYMKAIKSSDATVAASANVARVANVAQVATVASVATGPVVGAARSNTTSAKGQHGHAGTVVASSDVVEAGVDGSSVAAQSVEATGPANDARATHRPFEISNLDRLSDAVNATRVEDGSVEGQTNQAQEGTATSVAANDGGTAKARISPRGQTIVGAHASVGQQARGAQTNAKPQNGAAGLASYSGQTIGRSGNRGQSFGGDRGQSGERDSAGYGGMGFRSEATSQFTVADVSTEMTSTASQRAERIMAAQDAPARPLSQIVMSVDTGNGTTDRIQVALRGSTVSATIDAADHHAANAMRAHSEELVRSLTRDGVDVDSLRVRAATTTTAAPVATADSSQKSSDSSNNSRFNREAQSDQQRSQQRSNSERRHQQRDQREGDES